MVTHKRNFMFGHSLLVHRPLIPTPEHHATVPHWMAELAEASGYSFAADGQYGFLPQHSDLPPRPQWGFPGLWDEDTGEVFSEINYDSVMITAGNFIQYQSASTPYDGPNPSEISPVTETLKILDWVAEQEPGIELYIYENWPDMAPYISHTNGIANFPPTAEELANYHAFTVSSFHSWWIDYQDALVETRPNLFIKMIPVGPVIAGLLTNTALSEIPVQELYEDADPHGRPTIYFLASLVAYISMYQELPSAEYQIPESIHPLVQEHYHDVLNYIWNELQVFNGSATPGRVW